MGQLKFVQKVRHAWWLLWTRYTVYRVNKVDKRIEFVVYRNKTSYWQRNYRRGTKFALWSAISYVQGATQHHKSKIYTYHYISRKELMLRGGDPRKPITTKPQ